MKLPVMPPAVSDVFSRFPPDVRARLLELRTLLFETAHGHPEVGRLTETLKWGEPAYLTQETKSGSTIRMGAKRGTPTSVYLYFNCNTTLVASFREQHGSALSFVGNRAVALPLDKAFPRAPVQACMRAALTYHLGRKPRRER